MWVVGELVIFRLGFLQRYLVGDRKRISRREWPRDNPPPPILVWSPVVSYNFFFNGEDSAVKPKYET